VAKLRSRCFSRQRVGKSLGKDDPFVVRVLGDKTPLAAATAVIEGTHLDQATS
jgi:hypothetical protein